MAHALRVIEPTARHLRIADYEFFEPQPTSRAELPDPTDTIHRLAHMACEILAGTRPLDQLARWVTEDVFRTIAERSLNAAQSRRRNGATTRIVVTVIRTVIDEPRDGIVEGVTLVRIGPRTRAVAIRLEGLDHRWRASVIALL